MLKGDFMITFEIINKGNAKKLVIYHKNDLCLVFNIESIKDTAFVELEEIYKEMCKCRDEEE